MSTSWKHTSSFLALAFTLSGCAGDALSPTAVPEGGAREALRVFDGRTLDLTGSAYAITANARVAGVATVVIPTQAASGIGSCQSLSPGSSSVAALTVPGVASTGTLTSSVTPVNSGARTGIRSQSEIAGLNLLAGTITADAITAVAAVTYDSAQDRFIAGSTFTQFANLRVLGQAIPANVQPNTRIDLPGLGHVILYERRAETGATGGSVSVVMVRLVITTANTLGVDVGTEVVVGRALAAAGTQPQPLLLSGGAYAARVDGTVSLAPAVYQGLGCLGTDGQLLTRSTASVGVPGVLALDGLTSSARGTIQADSASAWTQSEVAEVNVLGGLVRATGVRAVAAGDRGTGAVRLQGDGEIATLVIAGVPVDVAEIEPNTRIELAGIGGVWLKRVSRGTSSVDVRMLEITVEIENPLAPLGAVIQVGVARVNLTDAPGA